MMPEPLTSLAPGFYEHGDILQNGDRRSVVLASFTDGKAEWAWIAHLDENDTIALFDSMLISISPDIRKVGRCGGVA